MDEALLNLARDLIVPRMEENLIGRDLNVHFACQEEADSFYSALSELFQKYEREQKCERKGLLKAVGISTLRSSLYTESYQLKLSAYDGDIYLEADPVTVFWKPERIFSFFQDDIIALQTEAKKTLIRVRPWDIELFRIQYGQVYQEIVVAYVTGLCKNIDALPEYRGLNKATQVPIYIGEHMGQAFQVACYGEEERT